MSVAGRVVKGSRDGSDHDAKRAVHGDRSAGEQETQGKGNALNSFEELKEKVPVP